MGRRTDLKAVRCQSALPDAVGEARLVPGVLPIQRVGLRNLQQDPRRAAAVHSCQTLHYPGNSLAVCLPARPHGGCVSLLLNMHQYAHQCRRCPVAMLWRYTHLWSENSRESVLGVDMPHLCHQYALVVATQTFSIDYLYVPAFTSCALEDLYRVVMQLHVCIMYYMRIWLRHCLYLYRC